MNVSSGPRSRPPSQYNKERELLTETEKLILQNKRAIQKADSVRQLTLMTGFVLLPLVLAVVSFSMAFPHVPSWKFFIYDLLTTWTIFLVTTGTIKLYLAEQKMQTWTKIAQDSFSNISKSLPSFEHILRYMLLTLLVAAVVKMSMRHIAALASRYGIGERLTAWSSGFKKTLQECMIRYWEITRSIAAQSFHSKTFTAVGLRLFISQTTYPKKDSGQFPSAEGSNPNQEFALQSSLTLVRPSSGPWSPERATSSPTFNIDDLLRNIPPNPLRDDSDSRTQDSSPVDTNQAGGSTPSSVPQPRETLDDSGSESTSSTRSTSSASASNAGTRANNSHKLTNSSARKRSRSSAPGDQRSQNDDNDDEDGWERPRKKKGRSPAASSCFLKRLKCPYHQREPAKYLQRSCSGQGFVDMAKLKDHLKRVHALPQHCQRCWAEMPSGEVLEKHIRQEPPCAIRPKPDDRMSVQDLQSLNFNRAPFAHAKSVEGKWRELYRKLFPNDAIIPSPYEDFSLNARFDGMLAQRLGEEMTKVFGVSQVDGIQRMKDKLPCLISECKRGILEAASPPKATMPAHSDKAIGQGKALGELQLPAFECQQLCVTPNLPAFSDDDIVQFDTTDRWDDFDVNNILNDKAVQSISSNNEIVNFPDFDIDALESLVEPPERSGKSNPLDTHIFQPTHDLQAEPISILDTTFELDPFSRPRNREVNLGGGTSLHVPNILKNDDLRSDIDWSSWIVQPLSSSMSEVGLSGVERGFGRLLGSVSPPSGMALWN